MTEDWRSIPGFSDYAVSSLGRVKRIKDARQNQAKAGNLKTPMKHSCGYLVARLWKNNKEYKRYIHRLVLSAFHGPCPIGYECNHIDGNKQNNKWLNLQYVTRRQNIIHAYRNGLSGRKHFKPEEVWLIRRLCAAGIDPKITAKIFKCDRSSIYKIKVGKTWAT